MADATVSTLSRRGLLGAALTGASLLAAGCATASGSPVSGDVDAVVVGAGIAGMAAAQSLRKAGHKVIVVEARDRLPNSRVGEANHPAALSISSNALCMQSA